MSRFEKALYISNGAVNPVAIANEIANAVRQARDNGEDMRRDCAVRLMVHQLAHVCGVFSMENDLTEYSRVTRENKKRAAFSFSVTFEIVTQESSENGEAESRGFVAQDIPLRDAIESLFETRTSRVDGLTGIEANESPIESPRWLTVYNGMEYETGAHESRSIHFPESMTPARRRHLIKLLTR